MCCSCSVSTKKFWLFGCGAFVLLAAMVLGLLWPKVYIRALYNELVLRNGSMAYNNWVATPLPMYMEFNMFHWTNSDQAENASVLPNFVEMGPYVFLEKHERVAIDWHPENGTVSYNQTKTWHFVPEMSNGTLDDMVTNVNVISASMAYAARDMNFILQFGVNLIMNTKGGSLVVTKSVREWLYDGYADHLLDFLIAAKVPTYPLPPFTRFGWFVDRNESSTYDGRINMFTGEKNIKTAGNVYSWNDQNSTKFYHGACSAVRGSTGELWHPDIPLNKTIDMFITDVCRSLPMAYEGTTEFLGISGGKWVGDDRMFDNGQKYPETSCYCTGNVCPDLMPGVLNVSDCRYGAPAFVSYPHFYLADESYRNAITGMKPNRSLHEFTLSMEPNTGIPMEVKARMQINILLQPIQRLKIYKNVPKVMVPMFWFTQRAALTDEIADQAKLAVMAITLGTYVAYGIAGLGAIVLIVGILLTVKGCSTTHTEFHNEDENDDELRR